MLEDGSDELSELIEWIPTITVIDKDETYGLAVVASSIWVRLQTFLGVHSSI